MRKSQQLTYYLVVSMRSLLSPNLDRLITTATSKGLAIGAKGHSEKIFCMLREGAHFLAACHVPQLDRFIPIRATDTGEGPAIGTNRNTHNTSNPREGAHFLAACHVPQLDRIIITT